MRENLSKWSQLTLSAIVGIVFYCSLTFVAILHYPGPFSPFSDYLSKLGNSSLNPTGAIYYNSAVILAGLFLVPFFLGLYFQFKRSENNLVPVLAMILGIVNALALIMSGVFNEDIPDLHFIWGLLIFISWIPLLFLSNALLYQRQGVERWMSLYGFGLAFYNIFFVSYVLLMGTTAGSIFEWIAVFSFQAWAILIMVVILWRYRSASKKAEKT